MTPKASPQSKKRSATTPQQSDDGKKPRTELEVKFTQAIQQKKDYAQMMMAAQRLQHRIRRDPDWSWAGHEGAKLDAAIRALESAVTSFGTDFLTTEVKEIKKAYKEKTHKLQTELDLFMSAVAEPLKHVGQQTRSLLAMQAARQRVG